MTDDEMVSALRAKGWRVSPPLTPETCKHPYMRGSASVAADGSGHSEGYCPDCGYRYRHDMPGDPTRVPQFVVRN